jgi:hypothetical protein
MRISNHPMGTRRNLNMKANYNNNTKNNQLNGFDESSVIDWDDPIEIESRDADSITENNYNSNNQKFIFKKTLEQHQQPIQQRKRQQQPKQQQEQSNQKTKPKLYTFYDYINKNKEENFNNANSSNLNQIKTTVYNNNSQELNKGFDYSRNQVLNNNNNSFNQNQRIQSYKVNSKEDTLNQEEDEDILITQMPISSGFGGYTGTTRRKPQPKVIFSICFLNLLNFKIL